MRVVEETNATETATTAAPTPTFDQCRARYGTFSECQLCGADLIPEHAHYKCRTCGWRDSCCD
ncbi:MAG: hypothetical protein F2594_02795 [Actinobacteria bacterium]|nr:hypothetical protein [Actinomycetota bacterium]